MSAAPVISVVIAAYQPGDDFDRVMSSLDAQTLPQDRFETIVVDDGSPDDTFARLSALAASRPNMRVERIENSGWPSRPRNLGTGIARGEWVLFMDHDDSLYPDALRRMAEYAAETRADVLSPKESKTSDAWWGMPALQDGNLPNAVEHGGITALLPMVPHKLYRRAFLEDHGIRFPEGRRQLWEDIYVNVEAWRHAERVAVLADTPAYLWHSSRTNNSKTYGPQDEEFWDRLDDLFAFIDRTLDGAEHEEARRDALLHQYKGRVLARYSRALTQASEEEARMGLRRARALQERYVPEEWDAELGKHVRARSILLRAGRPDLLQALWEVESDTAALVDATSMAWRDGALHLELDARWTDKRGAPVPLRRDGERLVRVLPEELLQALPAEVVDLADTLECVGLHVGVRDRYRRITWAVPSTVAARWQELDRDGVVPALSGTAVLDPDGVAFGAALGDGPHDLIATLQWDSAERLTAVRYLSRSAPATLAGRTGMAYRSTKDTLAIDLGGSLRNPISDGGTPSGPVQGSLQHFTLPLPRVRTFGPVDLPAALRLTPVGSAEGTPIVVPGRLRSGEDGAHLEAGTQSRVRAGLYEVAFRIGDGAFTGKRRVEVRGRHVTLLAPGQLTPPPRPSGLRPILGGVKRRLGG